MIKKHNFQPVKSSKTRETHGATLDTVAVRGQIVNFAADGSFELATGKAGYFLMRDVAEQTTIEALAKQDAIGELNDNPPINFERPYLRGSTVQADDHRFVWVEGADLIDDLDENTTVGTKVTTNAGKLKELTNSETEECQGIVREIVAAANSAAPAKRFRIEVLRSTTNIPAV